MAQFLFLSGRATANTSLSECKPDEDVTYKGRTEQSPHEQPESVPQFKGPVNNLVSWYLLTNLEAFVLRT